MYNRYVPKSDGSYQRNWIPEQHPHQRRSSRLTPPLPPPPPKQEGDKPLPPHKPEPVEHFLHQLLPKNFDTGDLIIVLLLLLLAGDCKEEQNNALLTLALYLFM